MTLRETHLHDVRRPHGTDDQPILRTWGGLCLAAGLVGAAAGAVMAATPPMVSEDRYSYPFDATWHVVAQSVFAVQHLGLLLGVLALLRLARGTSSRATTGGLAVAAAGLVVLTVVELVGITAAEASMDSTLAAWAGGLYALPMLLMGGGLLVGGVGVARHRVLDGWALWLTAVMGGYVFVVLFPAVAGPMVLGRVAIGVHMLLFAALGLAVMRAGARTRS